jgi:hypothetical protein
MDPNSTVTHLQHPHLPWYSVVVSCRHYQRATPLCTCPQPSCVTDHVHAAACCCAVHGHRLQGAHADVHTCTAHRQLPRFTTLVAGWLVLMRGLHSNHACRLLVNMQ